MEKISFAIGRDKAGKFKLVAASAGRFSEVLKTARDAEGFEKIMLYRNGRFFKTLRAGGTAIVFDLPKPKPVPAPAPEPKNVKKKNNE